MKLPRRSPAAVVLVLGVAACDGTWQFARVDAASRAEPALPADAGIGHGDAVHIPPRPSAMDASEDRPEDPIGGLADARIPTDAPRDIGSVDLPADVTPPLRVVPGRARLVGAGQTACSHQEPASGNGHRWCAFRRPGASGTGTELWVFDVTAPQAGAVPACDGSSPNCLRMTDNLWTDESFGGPPQAYAHRFDGDSLLFHTGPGAGVDAPFRGAIWLWRPGWTQPRKLADKALACFGDGRQALAFCIDDVDGSPAMEFDLRAGSVVNASEGLLAKVDRARVRRADSEQAFLATFTADGRHLVYSTTPSASSMQAALKLLALAEAGETVPGELLGDVMDWRLANDEKRVYFLERYTGGTAEGALMMAEFPTGQNPLQLARRTGRYVVLDDGSGGDRGVGYFVANTGRFLSEYRIIPNRDDLASGRTVFRYKDLLEDFHLSRDQRFTGYAKFDAKEGFNGFLARNDGTGECMLNSEQGRPAFEYDFLQSSGMVFWAEESEESTTLQDAWFADPDGCRGKQRFASGIGFYAAVRDDGLVFGDDYDGETVSLKYAAVEGGRRWPAGGAVRVRDNVDAPVVRLGTTSTHLVFQVSRGSDEDIGIYLFGPVPFGR